MGWGYIVDMADIRDGSLLLLNVEARTAAIFLDFIEIMNHEYSYAATQLVTAT
jgi:hypothetical protein